MGKNTGKTVAEQINEQIATTGEPIDTAAVADHAQARAQQLVEEIAASIDVSERAAETAALTPERIEDTVAGLVLNALTVFHDPEERVLGTNGKRYPLAHRFDDPEVDSTGEIVTVDRFEFLGFALARAQVSGLDYMLQGQKKKIADQRASIQSELRFGRNRGVDVAAKVERMADFLAHLIEQAALVEIAFSKAVEVYEAETGKAYANKERAAANEKAAIDSMPKEQRDRLQKLGVTA